MAKLKLNDSLQYVKGVGPVKAKVLEEFGFYTVRDILNYFPRNYLDRTTVTPIAELKIDQPVTIIGRVRAHGILHGKIKRYEVLLEDETGGVSLLWFRGVNFWQKLFKKDQWFAATGTVSYFQGFQIIHPDMERLEDESDSMIHAGRIIPVYPQTAEFNKVGLSSKGIRRITSIIFENLEDRLIDYLPKEIYGSYKLPDLHNAVQKIHYPDSREQIEYCRRRLAFDELLSFQFLVFSNKQGKETIVKKQKYKPLKNVLKEFLESLPFELTVDQKSAAREIIKDLQNPQPMTRMLQGDVGCGKTVVAIISALFAAKNKYQVAFMAPTEILSEQHYRNWKQPLWDAGVSSELLTASLTKAQKEKIAKSCTEGKTDILFGTHALIYDYVIFKNLGLVIIDEQHRFGVKQRGKLHAKGENPDLLVMTATPIPRTLALTLYGDLNITTIKSLPPGRKPVRTVWRTQSVREKVYQFVCDEVSKGGQVYIIYPLIEKSDKIELENVEDAYKELTFKYFKDLRVGMVHGRVKSKERDLILEEFRDGKLDILLATTVIEVGLDNPNATIMIIEHCERFGLAQLHQLRGRIGRGAKQATLIAIAHPPISEIAQKRLEYFSQTTDGFEIAEADLQLRGPGEIYGLKQSGIPAFKTVHLSSDHDLLEGSRKVLENLFYNYKNLDTEYLNLYNYLLASVKSKEMAFGGG